MYQPYGLYVTAETDGRIKRKLVTKSGTETVDSVSIQDELMNFSTCDMSNYLCFMKEIEKYAEVITEGIYENNGEIHMDNFDAFLAEVKAAYNFMFALSKNSAHSQTHKNVCLAFQKVREHKHFVAYFVKK